MDSTRPTMQPAAGHVLLLGDSVCDNGAYVPGEPDVVAQLRGVLPPSWSVTLLAVDGDVIGEWDVSCRAARECDHLVVSAGGNDALRGSFVNSGGLALFNDRITRAAFSRGLGVLDLRLLCEDDAGYANPIEPSAQGGGKIAGVIASWAAPDGACRRAQVFCSRTRG